MQFLVANKPFELGRRSLKAGDRFEIAPQWANTLILAGLAHAETEAERPKRKYKRRDMTAEGTAE